VSLETFGRIEIVESLETFSRIEIVVSLETFGRIGLYHSQATLFFMAWDRSWKYGWLRLVLAEIRLFGSYCKQLAGKYTRNGWGSLTK
jgi:hypothetical protein